MDSITCQLPKIEKYSLENLPYAISNLAQVRTNDKDRDVLFEALVSIMYQDAQKSYDGNAGKENSQLTGALILLNCEFHSNNAQIRRQANPFSLNPISIHQKNTSLDTVLRNILSHDKVTVDRGIIVRKTDKFLRSTKGIIDGKLIYHQEEFPIELDTYIIAAGAQFDGFQAKALKNFGGSRGGIIFESVLDLYTTDVEELFNGTKSPTGLSAVYANLHDHYTGQLHGNQTSFVLKTTVRDKQAGTGTLLEFNSNGEYREFFLKGPKGAQGILNVYQVEPEQILCGNATEFPPAFERRHMHQYLLDMHHFF